MLARRGGQRPEGVERVGEPLFPWPVEREPQGGPSGAVHEPRGNGEQTGPYRGVGQHDTVGAGVAGEAGPAAEVVGEYGAGEPGGVRGMVP